MSEWLFFDAQCYWRICFFSRLWNDTNEETKVVKDVSKLSTQEAIRTLSCQARQGANHTLRNLGLLVLGNVSLCSRSETSCCLLSSGSTGLLTLAWYLQRRSKEYDQNEETFQDHLDKALDLIREQYEKHIADPQTQPWLAISHIREKLIPEKDRCVAEFDRRISHYFWLESRERLHSIWERVKKYISEKESRVRSTTQRIKDQESDVWQWIKAKTTSPKKARSVCHERHFSLSLTLVHRCRNRRRKSMKKPLFTQHPRWVSRNVWNYEISSAQTSMSSRVSPSETDPFLPVAPMTRKSIKWWIVCRIDVPISNESNISAFIR